MILRILLGIGLMALGALFVAKSDWLYENIGAMDWADKYLGMQGGSRFGYKLIGIIMVIVGILLATNLFGSLAMGTIGKYFRGAAPPQ